MSGEAWPFVAREDEQERFAAALARTQADTSEDEQSRILLIEALGGYGKTTLLERFGQIARGEMRHRAVTGPRFRVVEIDWEKQRDRHPELSLAFGPRLLHVLLTLHGALLDTARRGSKPNPKMVRAFKSFSEQAARAPEFAATAERIAAGRAEAESNYAQRLDAIAAIGTTLTAASPASPAAPAVATVSPLLKLIRPRRSTSPSGAAGVDEAFRFEEALVRSFAEGLREISKEKPIVLLLDTCEIAAGVGPWLRQTARHSGGRVLWVFAGRLGGDGPNDDSTEAAAFRREVPESHLRVISLAKFSEGTTRLLLNEGNAQPLPAELLAQAAEVTRGIPLAVQLVARVLARGGDPDEVLRPLTKQGTSGYVVREVAQRYLVHVRSDPALAPDLPLLYGLALLHGDRSDPAVLEALWDRPEPISQVLDELARRHDFVGPETQRLHQEIEATLREYLLDSARRTEVRPANERARAALLDRLRARAVKGPRALADPRSRSDVLAVAWHTFWIDEDEGFRVLMEALPLAFASEPEAARELLLMASFFKNGFTDHHERLMRGFASMLTFGAFIDSWLVRRSSAPGLGSPGGYLGRIREQAQREDREFAREALIEAGGEPSWLAQDALMKKSVVAVVLPDTDADPVDWLVGLEEAAPIWPRTGRPASAFTSAATALRARLLKLDASSDLLRRAAAVDESFEPAPGSGRNLLNFAASLLDHGDQSTAKQILDRIEEADGENATTLAGYAGALYRSGKLEAAEDMYKRAIRADPGNDRVVAAYSGALWAENRLAEALAVLEDGLEVEPDSPLLLADRTSVLHAAGRHDEASAAFARAVAAEPKRSHELGNLAMYLDEVGRFEEAAEMYEKAVAADPQHSNNLIGYALLLLQTGNREKGDELLNRALATEPTDAGVLGNIALYLEQADRVDEAEEMFTRALEQDPSQPHNLASYAAFLAGRADDRFPSTAQSALERAGDDPEMKVVVHFCLWACGPLDARATHAAAVRELLRTGARTNWDPKKVLEASERAGHAEAEALQTATRKMVRERPLPT